jgi:tetratricopeptide (TPR) repeat protein
MAVARPDPDQNRIWRSSEEGLRLMEDVLAFSLDAGGTRLGMDDNAFFSFLYVPRPEESRLLSGILAANKLAVLVAPWGSGKTSIVRKVLADYLQDPDNEACVVDFRRLLERLYDISDTETPPTQLQRLHAIVKDVVWERYIGADPTRDREVVVQVLASYHGDRLLRIARERNLEGAITQDSLQEIFSSDVGLAHRESGFVRAKATLSQLVQAIKAVYRWKRLVLCMDNTDQLPPHLRPLVLTLAVDAYYGGEGSFGTVLAIREANLRGDAKTTSTGHGVQVVSLSGSIELAEMVHLDTPTSDFISRLLSTRVQHALYLASASAQTTVRREETERLSAAAAMAREPFLAERCFALANCNCRVLLLRYSHYVRYLVEFLKAADDLVAGAGARSRNSLPDALVFYRWAIGVGQPQFEWLLNPVTPYGRVRSGDGSRAVNCILDLLILGWLWNHAGPSNRVADLVRDFEAVGVREREACDALFRLYERSHECGEYVYLGRTEERLMRAQLLGNTWLRISPLGMEYITSVVSSVHFLEEAVMAAGTPLQDSQSAGATLPATTHERRERVLEHIQRMVEVHALALTSMRAALEGDRHPDWERYVRDTFLVEGQPIVARVIAAHAKHLRDDEKDSTLAAAYDRLLDSFERMSGMKRRVWQRGQGASGGEPPSASARPRGIIGTPAFPQESTGPAIFLGGLLESPVREKRELFEQALQQQRENRHDTAARLLSECLKIATAPSEKAALLLLIGNSLLSLGRGDEALLRYQKALLWGAKAGTSAGEAAALANIGLVYSGAGDLERALDHYQKALEIDRRIGNPLGEANALGNMGLVYKGKGDLDRALDHHQKALEIHRKIGNPLGEANALGNMGLVYQGKGDLDRALDHYQKALEIHRKIGNPLGEAQDLGNMGLVYQGKGDLDRAREALDASYRLYLQMGCSPADAEIVKRALGQPAT